MKKVISSERIPIKLWLDDMEEGALNQAKNIDKLKKVLGSIRDLVPVGFRKHRKRQDKALMPKGKFTDIVSKEIDNALRSLGTLGGESFWAKCLGSSERGDACHGGYCWDNSRKSGGEILYCAGEGE